MPSQTDFLPARRLPHTQILDQARRVGDCPVLIAMLDTAPGMVALLNPERQIVVCNDACAQAGGLARKEDALGMRPGELLCCIHATEMPGGGGASESCRHCGLAQALTLGQQGRANSGECLLQCHNHFKDIPVEYAVEVRPIPQLGSGWQCYSLCDISGKKRRESLERTFFHDIMNRAAALEGVSNVLAEGDMPPGERADFIGMLAVSARALVEEIRSQRTLLTAEQGELAVEPAGCDSLQGSRTQPPPARRSAAAQASGHRGWRAVDSLHRTPAARTRPHQSAQECTGSLRAGMTVTATCTVPTAGRIRFSIHNDSVMPKHVRAHVFQRSFTTKGPGRGLGAYSVRLLTERYLGGRAWFDSAPGEGTTFHAEFHAEFAI